MYITGRFFQCAAAITVMSKGASCLSCAKLMRCLKLRIVYFLARSSSVCESAVQHPKNRQTWDISSALVLCEWRCVALAQQNRHNRTQFVGQKCHYYNNAQQTKHPWEYIPPSIHPPSRPSQHVFVGCAVGLGLGGWRLQRLAGYLRRIFTKFGHQRGRAMHNSDSPK